MATFVDLPVVCKCCTHLTGPFSFRHGLPPSSYPISYGIINLEILDNAPYIRDFKAR